MVARLPRRAQRVRPHAADDAGPPADKLATLRRAIAKVLTDPAVIAEGAKTQRFIDFRDGETMQKLAQKLVSQLTRERKAQVREVVLKKFID